MFEFQINSKDYSKIHFIGVGGISMSGLAKILLTEGYSVSGSDSKDSKVIRHLKELGAIIYKSHSKDNIKDSDLVVYTDAISSDNEELLKAQSLNIPVIDRATFLGALMKNYENSIAVSGTHGKTTTTSLLSTILNRSTFDPTILLGGQLDEIGGNIKIGSKKHLITEACEYKGNILKYFPTIAIILNMDEDHLDYFTDMEHILKTFEQYARNLTKDAYLLINKDDPGSQRIIDNTIANVVSFGINEGCDYRAEDITFSKEGFPSFNLNIKNKGSYPVTLNVMGLHNLYNSLGAITAAHISGLSIEETIKNIGFYKGVQRRLEFKGLYNNVKIMDDYAHHPTEISSTLGALRNFTEGDIYCVFQPHTFTRTQILLNSFANSFSDADKVIITDIYAAREKDNGVIHSKDLANAIKNADAIYLESFEEIESYLKKNIKDGDLVITMGAGNIYLVGDSILNKFENTNEQTAI